MLLNLPNLITLFRLLLCFGLIASVLYAPPELLMLNPAIAVIIFALDGLDGYVARVFNQATFFGAQFDIAADRIIELLLWIALAYVDLAPLWVVFVFIVRFILVDTIRAESNRVGVASFDMMTSPYGRFLVSGKIMRGLYGAIKAVTFAWLLLLQALPFFPPFFQAVAQILIIATTGICILRGAPVIGEFLKRNSKVSG